MREFPRQRGFHPSDQGTTPPPPPRQFLKDFQSCTGLLVAQSWRRGCFNSILNCWKFVYDTKMIFKEFSHNSDIMYIYYLGYRVCVFSMGIDYYIYILSTRGLSRHILTCAFYSLASVVTDTVARQGSAEKKENIVQGKRQFCSKYARKHSTSTGKNAKE